MEIRKGKKIRKLESQTWRSDVHLTGVPGRENRENGVEGKSKQKSKMISPTENRESQGPQVPTKPCDWTRPAPRPHQDGTSGEQVGPKQRNSIPGGWRPGAKSSKFWKTILNTEFLTQSIHQPTVRKNKDFLQTFMYTETLLSRYPSQ